MVQVIQCCVMITTSYTACCVLSILTHILIIYIFLSSLRSMMPVGGGI